jgi:hypothetical protein
MPAPEALFSKTVPLLELEPESEPELGLELELKSESFGCNKFTLL